MTAYDSTTKTITLDKDLSQDASGTYAIAGKYYTAHAGVSGQNKLHVKDASSITYTGTSTPSTLIIGGGLPTGTFVNSKSGNELTLYVQNPSSSGSTYILANLTSDAPVNNTTFKAASFNDDERSFLTTSTHPGVLSTTGTATIHLKDSSSIKPGDEISGNGIPTGTKIMDPSGTAADDDNHTVYLESGTGQAVALTSTLSGSYTITPASGASTFTVEPVNLAGQPEIRLYGTSPNFAVGDRIYGPNIPDNTFVKSKDVTNTYSNKYTDIVLGDASTGPASNDVNLMGPASYEWYFFGSTAPTALTTTAGVQGSKTLRVVHSTTSTPAFNEKVTTGAGIKNSVVSVDTTSGIVTLGRALNADVSAENGSGSRATVTIGGNPYELSGGKSDSTTILVPFGTTVSNTNTVTGTGMNALVESVSGQVITVNRPCPQMRRVTTPSVVVPSRLRVGLAVTTPFD